MNLSIQKIFFIFMLGHLFIFSGCNPSLQSGNSDFKFKDQSLIENINEPPMSFEPPLANDKPTTVKVQPAEEKTTDVPPTANPDIKSDAPPKTSPPQASKFIQTAYDVMIKEGKSIGTACNFYLQRVLVRAGYKAGEFVANDFDVYAKNKFSSFKSEDFKIDATRSDKTELKKYLWSFDERTPFILQWSRPGHYGHVAILERIGEKLVIYQASYRKYTARRDETTIDRLLSSKYRAQLTVYSDFK